MNAKSLLGMALALLAAFSVCAYIAASWDSSRRLRSAEEWNPGSWEEILERYPLRDANAAALEIERLASHVGIDIAPRHFAGRARPDKDLSAAFKAVKKTLGTYLSRELGRSGSGTGPPPAELAEFLSSRSEELRELRSALASDEPPRWHRYIDRLAGAPLPNLLGHIDIHKLLIADALVSEHRGNRETVLLDLEASWRLKSALLDSPYLICQLISIAATRQQAGLLRRLEEVPREWQERLFEHDFRASLLTSLTIEMWVWSRVGEAELLGMGGVMGAIATAAARPYVRYCLADSSRVWSFQLERLRNQRDYCRDNSESAPRSPAPWNMIHDRMFPTSGMMGAFDRLARLQVDLELTGRWLTLRDARGRGGARFQEPRWEEPSTACPGERWIYEVSPDGEATLRLGREVRWPDHRGVILPTRVSSAPEKLQG